YLTEHLPPGTTPLVPVGGRMGVLPVGGSAEVEAIERALADGAALRPEGEAGRRRLAFGELAGPSPALVTDGLADLQRLALLGPPSATEVGALRHALADKRVDPQTRIGLITLVGQRSDKSALPALSAAPADTPLVLAALFTARSQLGAPAGRKELEPYLDGKD